MILKHCDRDDFVVSPQRDEIVIKADGSAPAAYNARYLIENVKFCNVALSGVGVFFGFQWGIACFSPKSTNRFRCRPYRGKNREEDQKYPCCSNSLLFSNFDELYQEAHF